MPAHSTTCDDAFSDQNEKQEERTYKMPNWDYKDDIVITGISGRFPESENIEELKKNLYDGIDMITENDRRWKPGLFGTPKRMGKLKDVTRFDQLFFGVHGKQAEMMDPMHRIMLEAAYEAIFDSGYEPFSLRGQNIGVYMGCSDKAVGGVSLSEDALTGYELLGMSSALLANRVSFTFGFTGPSMTVDTACSSTLTALNEAYNALRTNRCDAAIVGGATITLSLDNTVSFTRLGLLSKEGTCKVFDSTANGYVRSEAVGAIFLQRASDSRRHYASLLHCKLNNDGAKQEGISFPSGKQQVQLFKEVFGELNMSPNEVSYVEAHGTGTVAGDREESNAIAEFFCNDRVTPLPVGSVKSNLGHAEAASGTCTISKIVLSMEEGIIPPNLHYNTPNPHVQALVDGKMKVIAEKTPWTPGLVAANNFGFGGSNVHLVLRANHREKPERKERKIPRLVLANGRSEEAVKYIFDKVRDEQFTDESIVLLEEACKGSTIGMRYRGYGLVQKPGEEIEVVVEKATLKKRPIWFLFSGMGSQWSGMTKEMMKMDVFSKSIEMSAQVLKPYGVDLIHLLTEATEEELNHIISPFVTIAAVQIALVDVVKCLGIKPDGIVGHSVGELGCAYADGCFTAEQMLMAAFWRGNSCAKTELIKGAMAAIGLTWEETKKRCPEGVYPVCHNAEDSVTISGPAEVVKKFVEELNADNVFARIVKTCDIAFHSKYVEPASHLMRKELKKVIPNPLPRSSRWVSSSVPEEKWNEPEAQLSSVDYHVNNLLSPVLFNEAMAKVPKNALIIEFAPHSLLQAIVKRILGPESIYIGLMKRGHQDNLLHCLGAIGKMYTSNLNPGVKNLYDPVTYPVPRGTPMLNSIIKWDHDISHTTWSYAFGMSNKDNVLVDTFRGTADEYILGHKVDGRVLYPFMGYVFLAWKALAKKLMLEPDEIPIVVEDLNVYRASLLPKTGVYMFGIKFVDCNGNFWILEGGSVVASGRIRQCEDMDKPLRMKDENMTCGHNFEETFTMDAANFYKELRLRGYEYGPTFQGVLNADASGVTGRIKWEGKWVSFMDAMLQIPILCVPLRALLLPTRVKSIRIDPRKKPEHCEEGVPYTFNLFINVGRAGPVEIQGMHCGTAPRRVDHQSAPILEEQVFVPLYDFCVLTEQEMVEVEEYSHVCSTLAHKILKASGKNKTEISAVMNGFKEASSELIDKYVKIGASNHVLLKLLGEILEVDNTDGLQEKLNCVLEKHKNDIQSDFLTTVILKENALRAALDVVQDNHFSMKMKILEVSANSVCRKDVLRMLQMTSLGLLKYETTVARINDDPIPEGLVDPSTKTLVCDLKKDILPGGNDLVFAKDLFTDSHLSRTETMNSLAASVNAKGFVLLVERTSLSPAEKFVSILTEKKKHEQKESILEQAFKDAGLTIIAKKKDQITSVLYLLRKLPDETANEKPEIRILHVPEDGKYMWVDVLKNTLKEFEEKQENRLLWLVADNPSSGIVGLMNCLKQEPGGKILRYSFCTDVKKTLKFTVDEPFFTDIVKNDLVVNVFKNGQWGMFRHRLLPSEPSPVFRDISFLNVTKRGDLSSFKWIQSSRANMQAIFIDGLENSLIQVYYAPLNFRDVMLASGKLPPDAIPGKLALQECILGLEFVGREFTGRRVMGLTISKSMANCVLVPNKNLIPIPDHWTMEEASTVPVVYMTSYYALITRGRMQRGESVLIHSGTGGVGQAAISLSLSMGCKVFVTVGSEEKKAFLLETFPQLKENSIFNSRDVEFEFQVMNATKGLGVDLVLNSLADDKLQASVRCMRRNGRFLEIGKYDIAMNNNLGMAAFNKNITFHGVFLDTVLELGDRNVLKELLQLLADGIKTGVVKPLKANVFTWDKAEEAFRFMASGKHVGKVVLKIRDEETDLRALPVPLAIPSVPRTYCSPEKSYVITGGLGGFGLELAGWLVDRGAKKVVLSSRSPVKNEYQRLWIHRWTTNEEARVIVSNQDITSQSGAQALLQEANKIGPVGGIFHLAMVLHDGLFENLKPEDFDEVSQSKVQGVHHLDQQSKRQCPELDHFVVFSSISCGRGNPGQSNYGYANSVMERVVERRKHEGLPGLAIQWGGIGDVGVVYEKMGGNEVILKGTVPQRLGSCLEVLDRFMQEDHAVVSSFVPVEKAAFGAESGGDVVALLCKVLGIKDPSAVKPEMTLGELGMDSLMGVEIKQVLETEYDTVLSIPEVRQLSIKQLEEIGKKKVDGPVKSEDMMLTSGVKIIAEIHIPTEVIVQLNEVKGSQNVFFIHPAEGHTRMMVALANNLKKKVYGIQFTDRVPCASIQDMAVCYIEHIKRVQPHGPYHLVGMSYGCVIGFEMALQLQKTDQVKTFICIDGSPAVIIELGQKYVIENEKKEIGFSSTPLLLFFNQYLDNMPQTVIDAIINLPIGDTIGHARRILTPYLDASLLDGDVFVNICERMYQLFWAAKVYEPLGIFRGRVTLIKSLEGEHLSDITQAHTEDYGLNQHVDGNVEVFTIKCRHRNIADDVSNEVSKIINDRI